MSQSKLNFMRIERNQPATPPVNVETARRATAEQTASVFPESDRLHQVLANTPMVRSEQVARAKTLIADPNYPSPQQLGQIAGLLARNLAGEKLAP
jgi:hypothetical protein